MTDEGQTQYRGRDSAALAIIGVFFVLLSLLVLGGNFFGDVDDFTTVARNVNLAAGAILLLTGVFMAIVARRIRPGGPSPGQEAALPDSSDPEAAKANVSRHSPAPSDGTHP